jgi:hypothetical protein
VTREPEVEGKGGEISCVRQFDQRTRETQLRQVLVQRQAFHASEEIGEICRRRPGRPSDVDEEHTIRHLRLEELFGPANQAGGRRGV